MQIITKNIRWRALMETYQAAKFERSSNNLSWDIVLTDRWPEQKKRIRKAKTIDLHANADLLFLLFLFFLLSLLIICNA